MKLAVEVSDAVERRLLEEARRLQVSPESLAEALLRDSLSRSDETFRRATARVLEKNEELYRRLA